MARTSDFVDELEDNFATAEWLRTYLSTNHGYVMERVNAHWEAANEGQRHIVAIEVGLIDPAEVAEGLIEREVVPKCILRDYKHIFIEITNALKD